MRRAFTSAVAAVLLLLPLSAAAIISTYGGYIYPAVSTTCGAPCQKISAEWIVPTATDSGVGDPQISVHWIGVQSGTNVNGGASFHCPGNTCLGQFGTQSAFSGGVGSYRSWFELACSFSPCFSITYISDVTYPTRAGDHMRGTMQCTSNCSDNDANQTWRLTLENLTAAWTWNNNNTDFHWPLATTWAIFALEAPASNTKPDNFGVFHFANLKANDVLIDLNSSSSADKQDTTNGGARTLYPSTPMSNGSAFNVCYATGTYAAADVCPGGGVSGSTARVGP